MDKYTIPCTESQTKKALKFGAPIETYKPIIIDSKAGGSFTTPTMETVTAEQMLGWLEDNKLIIQIECSEYCNWFFRIKKVTHYLESDNWDLTNIDCVYDFSSRKEATLAAIDAALEYLSDKK